MCFGCMGSTAEVRIVLGGSWVVISRVKSRVTILITQIRGLRTPLITTPEPPSIAFHSQHETRHPSGALPQYRNCFDENQNLPNGR